jgi:hypothetical protein
MEHNLKIAGYKDCILIPRYVLYTLIASHCVVIIYPQTPLPAV